MTLKHILQEQVGEGTRGNQDPDNVKTCMVQHSYKIFMHLVVI